MLIIYIEEALPDILRHLATEPIDEYLRFLDW